MKFDYPISRDEALPVHACAVSLTSQGFNYGVPFIEYILVDIKARPPLGWIVHAQQSPVVTL